LVSPSVDGGGRAEHDPVHTYGPCCLEQRDSARDILAVVPRRIGHRFADERARCAVEDRVDALAFEEPAHLLVTAV
jgi:hypothetical protein